MGRLGKKTFGTFRVPGVPEMEPPEYIKVCRTAKGGLDIVCGAVPGADGYEWEWNFGTGAFSVSNTALPLLQLEPEEVHGENIVVSVRAYINDDDEGETE